MKKEIDDESQRAIGTDDEILDPETGQIRLKFRCTDCDSVFKEKAVLNNHVRIKHEGFRYLCDHCDFQATTQRLTNIHK